MLIALIVKSWSALRRHRISAGAGLLWTLVWGSGLVVVIVPEISSRIAAIVGVGRGVDVVLYVGMVTLYILLFRVLIHMDRLDQRIAMIVRHQALKEYGRQKTDSRDSHPHV